METTPASEPSRQTAPPVPGLPANEESARTAPKLVQNANDAAFPESAAPQDHAEEVDVWWGAYAGRALVPSFILCGLLTILILGGGLYYGVFHGTFLPRTAVHGSIGTIWLIQLWRWLYRIVAINYRLTTRRLFIERGFRHPGAPGIELSQIRQVVVSRGILERKLGVGRIHLLLQGSDSLQTLKGVRDPDLVALEIRKHMKRTQK
jgi:hypothetical protein